MSTNQTYKIAIIGPVDTVSGFAALGVEIFDARDAEAALKQLRFIKENKEDKAVGHHYAVVCIIENLLAEVDQAEFKKLTTGALPAVVLLPGPQGTSGLGVARLRQLAEQAVGSAII